MEYKCTLKIVAEYLQVFTRNENVNRYMNGHTVEKKF